MNRNVNRKRKHRPDEPHPMPFRLPVDHPILNKTCIDRVARAKGMTRNQFLNAAILQGLIAAQEDLPEDLKIDIAGGMAA